MTNPNDGVPCVKCGLQKPDARGNLNVCSCVTKPTPLTERHKTLVERLKAVLATNDEEWTDLAELHAALVDVVRTFQTVLNPDIQVSIEAGEKDMRLLERAIERAEESGTK